MAAHGAAVYFDKSTAIKANLVYVYQCHTYLRAVNRQVRFGHGLLRMHTLPYFQFCLTEYITCL